MNYLIIILIVFIFTKSKNNGLSNLLGGISLTDIAPILNLLENSSLIGDFPLSSIKNLLSGEFDFSEILPLITSFLSLNKNTADATNYTASQEVYGDGLEPIKDLFSGDFYNALENYFEG